MNILGHEYNDYVIGYVIHTDHGGINAQFNKFSPCNHPEPKYYLYLGCEGDETADNFTEEEKERIRNYIAGCEEMHETEKAFTTAVYNGSDIMDRYPLPKHEIFELAGQ